MKARRRSKKHRTSKAEPAPSSVPAALPASGGLDFRMLFESVPGLYLVLKPDLTICAASDAYLEATMTRREDILGRPVFDVFPDNPAEDGTKGSNHVRASMERVFRDGVPDALAVLKYDIRRPESEGGSFEERYWSPVNSPVFGTDGSVEFVIHRVEDMTEFMRVKQQKLESVRLTAELRSRTQSMESEIFMRAQQLETLNAELRKANAAVEEASRFQSEFFANVSHELRTPLALVLGALRRVKATAAWPSELEVVERNALLLLKHVNDLLDVAKLDAGQMGISYAPADLTQIARFAAAHFELLASEKRITFTVDAPEPVRVQADAEKILRVLMNLLSNAFKFTLPGGTVVLSARGSGERAWVRVADSGPGVPPAARAAIFERFRQASNGDARAHGGTGLGLAIVKEFVELHHGRVRLEETPQGGASFVVELPVRAPEGTPVEPAHADLDEELARVQIAGLADAPARARQAAVPAGAPLVLLVEDNPDMQAFLESCLARHYRVAVAGNGEEGLEKALVLRPDLILSDVMMPRMSGDQMALEIRRRPELAETPIVMLTAKADDDLRLRLLRLGIQEYLYKPFAEEEVLARIARLIEERRRADGKLRDAHALLSAVTEGIDDAIFVKESSGRYLLVNAGGAELLGSGIRDVIGKSDADFMPAEAASRIRGEDDEVMASGEMRAFEGLVETRAGERAFSVKKSPYRNPDGAVVGVVGIAREVTDAKQVQRALVERAETFARLNASMDRFALQCSSDLREPLRTLETTLATIASVAGSTDSYLEECLRRANAAAHRVRSMLDGIREFAGAVDDSVPRDRCESAEALRIALATLEPVIAERGAIVTSEDLPEVQADEAQLARVFLNLLGNGLKFNRSQTPEIHVEAERAGQSWTFSVRDNGLGIPAEQRADAFVLFRRLHSSGEFPGEGVGLALCKRIVERHGGRIWIDAAPRAGTTVKFTLAGAA